jgi:hypothetical protein
LSTSSVRSWQKTRVFCPPIITQHVSQRPKYEITLMYRIPLGCHKENPPPSPKPRSAAPKEKLQPDATAIDWPENIATDWPDATATNWPDATATDWTGPHREHPFAAPNRGRTSSDRCYTMMGGPEDPSGEARS